MKTVTEITPTRAERVKNVCAYIRVSSGSFEQEHSFAFQKDYWESRLTNLPNMNFVGLYADEAISGKSTAKRIQFNKMVADALAGKIDVIYTKSISRFARNFTDLINTIRQLKEHGVAIIFEKENINSLETKSELLLQLQGILAEHDLKSNSENQKWAYRKKFQRGEVVLCKSLLGYNVKDNKLTIEPVGTEIVRTIFRLYLNGMGLGSIVKWLYANGIRTATGKETWRSNTLKDILTNEKYAGDILLQKTFTDEQGIKHDNNGELKSYYISNNHEPIISRADFEKVQEMLKSKYNPNKACGKMYEFSGKLVCGKCGSGFRRRIAKTAWNTIPVKWMCGKSLTMGVGYCDNRTIPDEILKQLALSAYNEYANLQKQTAGKAELHLKELLQEEQRLNILMAKNYIAKPDYESEIAILVAEVKRIEKNMKSTRQSGEAKEVAEYDPKIMEFVESIVITDFNAEFHFNNGAIIKRSYEKNGRKFNAK
jgi:DNA invertase Pin-like site-specific DNA recombinase